MIGAAKKNSGDREAVIASSEDEVSRDGALSGSATMPHEPSSHSNGLQRPQLQQQVTLGSLQGNSPSQPITLASLSSGGKDARGDGKNKPAHASSQPITLASLSSSSHQPAHLSPGLSSHSQRKTDGRRHGEKVRADGCGAKQDGPKHASSSRRTSDRNRHKKNVAKSPVAKKACDGYLVQDFDDEEDADIGKARAAQEAKEKEEKETHAGTSLVCCAVLIFCIFLCLRVCLFIVFGLVWFGLVWFFFFFHSHV
jgi:hypothetical protein